MAFIGKLDETDASRLASIEPKVNDNYRPPQNHHTPPAPSYNHNQNQRNSQPSSYLYQQRAPSQPNHMMVILN